MRTILAASLLLLFLAPAGCRTTPDQVRAIEKENELLREQIQVLKERCVQSRELEVRPEDEKR